MKNANAVALGRLGGLVGGPARARALSADRRSEIAREAVLARWTKARSARVEKQEPQADLKDRSVRCRLADQLSSELGIDAGVAEQVLFMKILPAWERLARGLRRSRLGTVVKTLKKIR